MRPRHADPPAASLSFALSALVCAACSFALARAGIAESAHTGVPSLPEPLAGFALAALLIWGSPYVLAIGAGAFGAWFAGGGHSLRECAGAALALVVGAWIASAFLRRVLPTFAGGFEPRLERLRDALALFAAIALGSAVEATLSGAPATGAELRAWLVRGLSNGVGCLLVAPLLCAWSTRVEPAERAQRSGTLVAAVLAIAVLAALAFGDVVRSGAAHLAALLAFPVVVWSALACGARGASLATLVFAAAAVLQTARGGGPFAVRGGPLELTALLGVLASTSLFVAAFEGQRAGKVRRAHAERTRLELALNGSSGGLWEWELASGRVEYSPRFRELLGLAPDSAVSAAPLHALVHPDDHAVFDAAVQQHLERGAPYEVDVRLRGGSGDSRWFHVRGVAQRDERGDPVRLLGSISDIHAARVAEQELLRHVHELEGARDAHARQSHELTLLVAELADARARLAAFAHDAGGRAGEAAVTPVDFDRKLDELVKLLSASEPAGADASARDSDGGSDAS